MKETQNPIFSIYQGCALSTIYIVLLDRIRVEGTGSNYLKANPGSNPNIFNDLGNWTVMGWHPGSKNRSAIGCQTNGN